MKRILSTLIITSLMLGLCLYVAPVQSSQASGQARTSAAQGGVRFVPRSIRAANRKLRYTIKAKYPQAVGAQRNPRLARLNQELHALITKDVSGFRDDFAAPEERMGVGSSYEADYQMSLKTADLISLTFYVNTYYEGAAHGNQHTIAFNYDLTTGRVLALKDLFKPGSDYLKVISDYATAELKKKLLPDADEEWIEKGAGADDKNYRSWNIKKDGLFITFDPYQVVYYAAGPQEVTIPYSVLKNIIDPQGPLAKVAGH